MEKFTELQRRRKVLQQVSLRISRLKKEIDDGMPNPCDFIALRNLKSFRYSLASEIDAISQEYKSVLRSR